MSDYIEIEPDAAERGARHIELHDELSPNPAYAWSEAESAIALIEDVLAVVARESGDDLARWVMDEVRTRA
jgi:hypothetical protein